MNPSLTQTAPASGAHAFAPPAIDRADRWLRRAATSWVALAVAGQAIFAAYVVAFYGGGVASGHESRWNRVAPAAWTPGATGANAAFVIHVLCAAALLASGALQLLPALRRRAPRVHRWNGRVFVVAAIVAAVGGTVMVLTRPTPGDASQHAAILLNAALILVFAGAAWRTALARRFDAHRRWALRLWLAMGGVWFFRIMLMGWIVANHGPAGFDPKTFTGPALTTIAFAQTLLPLALLEATLRVRDHGGAVARGALAALLGVLTLATALGIAAASMILWIPHL